MHVRPFAQSPLRFVLSTALLLIAGFAALALASSPAQAAKSNGGVVPEGPDRATVKIKPLGLKNHRATIMSKVTIKGSIKPFRNKQRVSVYLYKDGKRFDVRKVKVHKAGRNYGSFRTSVYTRDGLRYGVRAKYWGKKGNNPVGRDSTEHKSWKVRYVGLAKDQCGRVVAGFRKALNRLALVPDNGRCFNGKMERAVLAYRKLNDMSRNSRASKSIVKRVFNGKGGYHVRRPGLGNHMEAPLSKQVMVFSKGRKPYAIFPIASGAPATPTILGTYSFYWKDPGYNSLGMYYSSYFIRGYATHGYQSVPNYPASHGCLRTFISDQPRIYRITRIGMPVYTFGNAFRGRVEPYKVKVSGGDLGPDLGATGGLDPTSFN
ncbi:MAG TPA: L,D-transpeptidase [Solirubrobacterales bacterium]|nr:L,D-transpeptidase [Solirubrobacterales bacterium]